MLSKLKYQYESLKKRKKFKNFYALFLQNGDLCFDIGANIGNRTESFLSLGAKVIAVEPQNECIEVLQKLKTPNNQLFILPKVIGAINGSAQFYISNVSEVSTLSKQFIAAYQNQEAYPLLWNKTVEVNMVTLDSLIKQYGLPKFCKIDIEGYEEEAFKGLSHPIPNISFEYNIKLKAIALNSIQRLAAIDAQYVFNFSPYESMKFSLENWLSQSSFLTFMNEMSDDILTGDIYASIKK